MEISENHREFLLCCNVICHSAKHGCVSGESWRTDLKAKREFGDLRG